MYTELNPVEMFDLQAFIVNIFTAINAGGRCKLFNKQNRYFLQFQKRHKM